jgi:hypothetical protein
MTSKHSSLDLAVAKSAEAWAFWARKRDWDWSCRVGGFLMPCLLFEENYNITVDSKHLFFASKESYHLTLYFLNQNYMSILVVIVKVPRAYLRHKEFGTKHKHWGKFLFFLGTFEILFETFVALFNHRVWVKEFSNTTKVILPLTKPIW